ncbi:MAG TPA: arginase family protein [Propionibacteriaceae bacterium]|jgi:arginase
MTTWGLLGVPSSAAAHWPGQEKAPRALRAAGLLASLRSVAAVEDHGDLPLVPWRRHPTERSPHNVTAVAEVLQDARREIGAIFAAGRRPLVVGGECTLAIALVAAAVDAGHDVGLMYVDGGQDLMIPADHAREPILDGTGVAHMLDLPGTVEAIAALGPRRPLLHPGQVCFFGFADEEEDVHGLVPSPRHPSRAVAADPGREAELAVEQLTRVTEEFVVHFDVDVLDFFALPAADVPLYGRGLRLESAVAALQVLVRHPGFRGLTFCEFNPDHAEPDTAGRLVGALVSALPDRAAARTTSARAGPARLPARRGN